MHHLVDTKLEVKIYGREHKCFVLVRDGHGEYEVEITPTKDGRLDYQEMFDRQPIDAAKPVDYSNVSRGPAGIYSS